MLSVSPDLVLHIKHAIIDGFISVAVYDGGTNIPYFEKIEKYLESSLAGAAGTLFVIVMFLGAIYMFITNTRITISVVLLPLLKLLILSLMNRTMPRWGLEIAMCYIFFASCGLVWLIEKRCVLIRMTGIAMATFLALELFVSAIRYDFLALSTYQDNRYVLAKEFVKRGISPENSFYENYTSFIPGCRVTREWGDHYSYGWEDSLFLDEDGKLVINGMDILYVIDNRERYNEEWSPILAEQCPLILSMDGEHPDLFWDQPQGIVWNDVNLISDRLKENMFIIKGAQIGYSIDVYDVSNVQHITIGDDE